MVFAIRQHNRQPDARALVLCVLQAHKASKHPHCLSIRLKRPAQSGCMLTAYSRLCLPGLLSTKSLGLETERAALCLLQLSHFSSCLLATAGSAEHCSCQTPSSKLLCKLQL
ncbi:hypothetical protein WJX74_000478 [Apatococcus lobatus]|uniref:Uncharacterized protein n=1 Tax=Apatococcus lobatus TaxID=904363 RepID=A0AAW1RHN2_9CHLO